MLMKHLKDVGLVGREERHKRVFSLHNKCIWIAEQIYLNELRFKAVQFSLRQDHTCSYSPVEDEVLGVGIVERIELVAGVDAVPEEQVEIPTLRGR